VRQNATHAPAASMYVASAGRPAWAAAILSV
jgi:hypothetical protein